MRLDTVIKSLSVANAAIKNTASPIKIEGWYPTFSASGQDVWLPDYRFDQKGIVVSAVGARCGKAFKADGRWNVCANTHALSIDESIADRDYCWYMLNNESWWIKGGTAQPFVKVKDSLKREHAFPSLSTQREIVHQLDQINNILCLRKKELEWFDDLIKARFVEMFGDPETNCNGYPVKKLDDLVTDIIAGWSANGEARQKNDDEKAVLKVSAVTHGFFKPEEHKALPIDIEIKKYVFPQKGDLLFSRANTRELVGATAIIEHDYPDLLLPDKLWRVLFTNELNVYYAKYVLSSESIRKKFSAQSTGTSGSMFNVSSEKFRNISLPVPSRALQDDFEGFVHQVDKSKSAVQKALDEVQLLFDSLMQQYFG